MAIDSPRPVMRIAEGLMNVGLLDRHPPGNQASFVRKSLFGRVGGFPDQPLMEDLALSGLLKRHGPPAGLCKGISTSARRWERHGPWRTMLLMWRVCAAYFLGADPATLARRGGCRAPQP